MNQINALYKDICTGLFSKGEFTQKDTEHETKELLGCHIVLSDLENNYITLPSATPSYIYLIAENLWYFSGINRVNFIGKFADMWNRISDDGITNNSAYGYILQEKHGFNQIEKIIELLKKDKYSRRAVLNINEANSNVIETRDEPCTIALQFLIRNDKLNCFVMMRSNDVFFGLKNDITFFTELQKYIAYRLGIECGVYNHYDVSLHLYKRDYEKMLNIINEHDEENVKLNLDIIWKDEELRKELVLYIDNYEIASKEDKNKFKKDFEKLCIEKGILERY